MSLISGKNKTSKSNLYLAVKTDEI